MEGIHCMASGQEVQDALRACEAEMQQVEDELNGFQAGQNTAGSAQRYGRLRDRQSSLSEQIRHLRKEAADAGDPCTDLATAEQAPSVEASFDY